MNHPKTLAVAAVAAILLLAGCSAGSDAAAAASPSAGIGDWPTFLPSPSAAGLATGSADNPAMSYAGSPVAVTVGQGTVTVNLQGPSYPADTKVGADQVDCSYTVDLSGASAPVSLSATQFTVLDHAGQVHALQAAPGTTIPTTLAPGQSATLTLVTTLPSGEGLFRYAPDGSHTAAAWDYVAETD